MYHDQLTKANSQVKATSLVGKPELVSEFTFVIPVSQITTFGKEVESIFASLIGSGII